jgi:hypothetical protein
MALFKPSVKKLEEESDIAGLIQALAEDPSSPRHDEALDALGPKTTETTPSDPLSPLNGGYFGGSQMCLPVRSI